MSANLRTLIDKLQSQPSDRQAEVQDFVEFRQKRDAQERSAAAARLGEAFKKLDALDEQPMSSEETQAEIDAARAERRARARARARADRR
ncbi:MAG: hypothetical protein IT481_11205 [Gammaproteobacteria bacterium]|nr:hypothetical protein [Gammaproteobacteria bacterium]